MAKKLFLSQRTNRHVVKRLDSSYSYDASFGVWQTAKIDNTGLNFPWGIAADPFDNIYVCDGNNSRIVKLNSSLVYQSSVDVSSYIGRPHSIFYDSTSGSLYAAGVYNYQYYSIAKITTGLVISKYNSNISPTSIDISVTASSATDLVTATSHGLISGDLIAFYCDVGGSFPSPLVDSGLYYVIKNDVNSFRVAATLEDAQHNTYIDLTTNGSSLHVLRVFPVQTPRGISRGFAGSDFLISGTRNFLNTIEGAGFSTATVQPVVGQSGTEFYGHVKHSNGYVYALTKELEESRLVKIDSSYNNIGDSETISKLASVVNESYTTNLLVYDIANKKVVEYDPNLNYVSTPYTETGSTIQLDASEITGITEIDV